MLIGQPFLLLMSTLGFKKRKESYLYQLRQWYCIIYHPRKIFTFFPLLMRNIKHWQKRKVYSWDS